MDKPSFTPKAPRLAASIALTRMGAHGLEAFWVRRGQQLKFAGGFYAFAGGRVDDADALLPLSRAEGLDAVERANRAAALRELFEETGVLAVPGAARIPKQERDEVRTALTAREGKQARSPPPGGPPFQRMLAAHGLVADAGLLRPAGRWITPPSVPVRFDTRFYRVVLPDNESAEVWPGELADGEWISPQKALARWDDGSALLHPPAWHTLRCLGHASACEPDGGAAQAWLEDPARAPWADQLPIEGHVVQRMEFQRGVLLFPLLTPTLPPATHTNCLLVGDETLAVVDPGSPWPEEQAALERELQRLSALGRRPKEIVLTHYHLDHVAGAMPLSQRLGLPIAAHRLTAERLRGEVRVDRVLEDGEPLAYGPRGFRALHLPGHTQGHLCFVESGSGAVLAGDLVAGGSTVVIDPPEGDMHDYLRSLDRLLAENPQTIYPAHGQVAPGGAELLRGYVAHRLERERKVAAALSAHPGPAEPQELVPAAYPEIGAELYPLAARSLLAHLLKLVKDGRASEANGRFSAR
jgi:endoribonuclease LACTB2